MRNSFLILEFALLFVLLPLGFRYAPWSLPPLPVLWIATAYCWFVLRRDATFDQANLWNRAPFRRELPGVLGIFAIVAVVLLPAISIFARPLLFSFIRHNPLLWAAVMVLYPIVSVYPQGLVYRAFLMHRYRALFSEPRLMLLVSAAVFAWMHIVFRNPLAVTLTFFGGLLFAWRYAKTASLATSSFEHALYGCLLFTAGLGQYFYYGRVAGTVDFLFK